MDTALIEKLEVVIREVHDGWDLRWSDGGMIHYPTAVKALEAVEQHGRELAEAGQSTVQRITWEPTTEIGRAVVRVLTEETE